MKSKNQEMIYNMEVYGGSFVKALAELLIHADPFNYQKLENAFPEYFKEYSDMAETK